MKFFIFIILLISSHSLFAQGSCNYIVISAQALSLVQDVAKVQTSRFDPKFCQAFKDCGSFGYQKTIKDFLKENVDKLSTLDSKIEEAQQNMSIAKAEYEKLTKGSNEDAIKALAYTHWMYALEAHIKKNERLNTTYKNYVKDPKSSIDIIELYDAFSASPTLEKSQLKVNSIISDFDYTQRIKGMNGYLDEYQKKIDAAKAASPPDLKKVKYYEDDMNVMKVRIQSYEAYQKKMKDFLANPKTTPFPYELVPKPKESTLTHAYKSDPCAEAEMYYQSSLRYAKSNMSGHCGMTPAELAAINYYANSGYGCMNSYLRVKEEPYRDLDLLTQALNSALAKLPSYKGLVRRGGNLPASVKTQHTKGSVIEYKAYTSTSTSNGFKESDLFMIYSKNGKPIMSFSPHEGEFEVLFKEGTKFKILDVQPKGHKTYYVMKEVGTGTPAEEAKADAQLMSSITSLPTEEFKGDKNSDKWACPIDEKASIPKMIQQKKAPRF